MAALAVAVALMMVVLPVSGMSDSDGAAGATVDVGEWSSPPGIVLSTGQQFWYNPTLLDATISVSGSGMVSEGGFLVFSGGTISGTADVPGTYEVDVEALWIAGDEIKTATQTISVQVCDGMTIGAVTLAYDDGWRIGTASIATDDQDDDYGSTISSYTESRIFQEGVYENQSFGKGYSKTTYKEVTSASVDTDAWNGLTVTAYVDQTDGYWVPTVVFRGTPIGGTDGDTTTVYMTAYVDGIGMKTAIQLVYATSITTTIHFVADEGTGLPDDIIVNTTDETGSTIQTLIIPDQVPVRDGFTFMKWEPTSRSYYSATVNGKSYSLYAGTSLTLQAVWGKTATVSYDLNGGTPAQDSTATFAAQTDTKQETSDGVYGSKSFTLYSYYPVKADYTFLGWSLDGTASNGVYSPGETVQVEYGSTLKLLAVWRLNLHTVSIEAGEGGYVSMGFISARSGSTITVNGPSLTVLSSSGDSVASSSAVAYSGYTFAGWRNVSGTVDSDRIVAAVFTTDSPSMCTVSFDPSIGGSVSPSSVRVPTGSTVSVDGSVLLFTTPSGTVYATATANADKGYGFGYWTVDSKKVTADATIPARFLEGYTVTFHPGNHGTVSQASMISTNGSECAIGSDGSVTFTPLTGGYVSVSSVTLTAYPGYAFAGWFLDEELTTPWEAPATIAGNMDLYAKWTVVTCIITFEPYRTSSVTDDGYLGGTVSMASIEVPYGTVFKIYRYTLLLYPADGDSANPDRIDANPDEGCYFTGWSVRPTGTITSDMTITASFSIDTSSAFTIHISAESGGYVTDESILVPTGTRMTVTGTLLAFISASGDTVASVTAFPNNGFSFTGWSGDLTEAITGDRSIAATFTAETIATYRITFVAGNGGGVSETYVDVPNGSTIATSGSELIIKTIQDNTVSTVSAVPDRGYVLESWGNTKGYILADRVVTANFGLRENVISFIKEDGSKAAEQTVLSGASPDRLSNPHGKEIQYYLDEAHTQSYGFDAVYEDMSIYIVYKSTVNTVAVVLAVIMMIAGLGLAAYSLFVVGDTRLLIIGGVVVVIGLVVLLGFSGIL